MDFGLLPPEVNSGRMYAGVGSGPMLAAAAAWDGLAEQLYSAAAYHGLVISDVAAEWRGPSSANMAVAAAPYTAWLSTTAAQAEQTASQARAAAAAYETAFVATVPPPVVAANRALLTSLIATNFMGQNTPAIAATEAHYAEMWAQDAAAMFGYAGAAAMASKLTLFSPPPRTIDPAGQSGQAGAFAQAATTAAGVHAQALPHAVSATPHALQSLAAPATSGSTDSSSVLSSLDNFLIGPLSPVSLSKLPIVSELLGAQGYLLPRVAASLVGAAEHASTFPAATGGALLEGELGSGTRLLGSAGLPGISAGVGRAGMVGGLSVPHGWASAAPAIKTAAATAPQSSPANATAPAALTATSQESPFAKAALPSLATRAMTGTGGAAARSAGMRGAAAEQPATATTAANVSNIFVIPEVAE